MIGDVLVAKKTIVYVGNKDKNFIKLPSFSEMFTFINSKIKIDLLIIDLDMFGKADSFNILNSILTLRETYLTNFKVACLVSEMSDWSLVKEVLSIKINGLIPCENWLGKENENEAINAIIANKQVNHKDMLNLLSKKETKIDFGFTPRQEQIHKLICDRGLSNKTIARTLNISESTVKLHVTCILKKIGAKNRAQMIVFNRK